MITHPIRSKVAQALVINDTKTVQLDAVSDLTEIMLLMKINLTAASASPAVDGLEKFIKGITLKDSDGVSKVSVTDSRAIVQHNKIFMPNRTRFDALPTTDGAHELTVCIFLHPGKDGSQPYDKSAVFNGFDSKYLSLDIQLGTAADLGTGYTLGTVTVEPTLASIQYSNAMTERAAYFPKRGDVPAGVPAKGSIVTEKVDFSSATATLGQTIEIPTGRLYLDTLLMVLNAAGARSDTVVDRIAIKFPTLNQTHDELSWGAAKEYMRRTYPNLSESDLVGILYVDWANVSGLTDGKGNSRLIDNVGFNTIGMPKGEVEFAASTTAAGTIIRLNHYVMQV